MELIRFLRRARRWLWLLIAAPIIASGAAWIFTGSIPTVYQSHEQVLVRPVQPFAVAPGSAALSSDQIVLIYVHLMTEPPLLEQVSSDLGLNATPSQLASQITITVIPGTTILDVAVTSGNPVQARDIATKLVEDFIAEIRQLQPPASSQAAPVQDNVIVVAPATLPKPTFTSSRSRNVAAAFAAGLLAAIAFVAGLQLLDRSIKDDDDIARVEGLGTIGHVPFIAAPKGRRRELISVDSADVHAEAYRSLRTNVLFNAVSREMRTIVVTSAMPGEGKSRTAANLAIVLAQAGHRTLLVDADLRNPSQRRLFGRANEVGLTNLMVRDRPDADAITPDMEIPNLWLLTSGPRPPNPSELLGSGRMGEVLTQIRQAFGFVILDTPPTNFVTDASVVAAKADATIIVVEQGRTTLPALARAVQTLTLVGAHVIGVVLNKLPEGEDRYAYGYGPAPASAKPEGTPATVNRQHPTARIENSTSTVR
jgi:tyrosine-protein kinase